MSNPTALEQIEARFPDYRTLGAALQEGINDHMIMLRKQRGEVRTPEDVFPAGLWLQGIRERLEEYGHAFVGAARLAEQYAEEELVEAVGEQDGIPQGNLTVPDGDGSDVKLTAQYTTAHSIDREAVFAAIARDVIDSSDLTGQVLGIDTEDDLDLLLHTSLTEGMRILATETGKYDPQVSKVRAFAKDLSRRGGNTVASTVTTAIRSTKKYTGVKMSRQEPKP